MVVLDLAERRALWVAELASLMRRIIPICALLSASLVVAVSHMERDSFFLIGWPESVHLQFVLTYAATLAGSAVGFLRDKRFPTQSDVDMDLALRESLGLPQNPKKPPER